jgi:hypothetical protein
MPVTMRAALGSRRSKHINKRNVAALEVAWKFQTGDAGNNSTIECTPIVVGGVMYLTTRVWRSWPWMPRPASRSGYMTPKPTASIAVWRYWTDGKASRILAGLPDGRLLSLDARQESPICGSVKTAPCICAMAMSAIFRAYLTAALGPIDFRRPCHRALINSEGQPGAPGDVRAFDVRTGREVWRFHTVPRPYEFGHQTWAEGSWKERSGVNAWSGYTVDDKNGILFAATGSASSDFYGGDRKGRQPFCELPPRSGCAHGTQTVAFQTVHHDLWDSDNPCPPLLCMVKAKKPSRCPPDRLHLCLRAQEREIPFSHCRATGTTVHSCRRTSGPHPTHAAGTATAFFASSHYPGSHHAHARSRSRSSRTGAKEKLRLASGASRQASKARLSRPAIMAAPPGRARPMTRHPACFTSIPTTCRAWFV